MVLGRALFAVALALVLVPTAPMAVAQGSTASTDLAPSHSELPQGAPVRIEPSPIRSQGEKDLATVIIATTNVADLANAVSRLTGEQVPSPRSQGFGTPLLTLPRWMIEEIRGLPTTMSVVDYVPPTKQMPEDPDTRSLPQTGILNWNATINHKAPLAWARNITGDGVNVAIVDDGVDFGHPDLQGTMARVTDPASPYSGWPIAFDPFSMGAYLRAGGDPRGTWYADTSSTDSNVTHTLRVDGKNDFWTDGSELIATDPSSDIGVPDFDLVTLYVTQDAANWYVGFSSRANHTTMAFELYVNTTSGGGAPADPLGNYMIPMAGHLPEFAVYMVHNGLQPPGRYDLNDTIPSALVYKWNPGGGAWDSPVDVTDPAVGGQFSYGGYKFNVGEGFVEMGLPKAYLGDPQSISLQLFTVGDNRSHAQDSVYSDLNVAFPNPDWTSAPTTLSAMTIVGPGYWRHTYTRSDDTVGGQPNVQFTWPVQYIPTGTSRSGQYLFGDLPDKNYPLTRILVVDEAMPGVYDTVYADLDHNKDFHNDKAIKRYGKYDASGFWHPPSWPGIGTIFDETVWADTFDPAGGVAALAWSPDGRWLATGGRDHVVIVWDTTTWLPAATLTGHHGRVDAVAWNPASTRLAAAHDDVGGRTQYSVDVWQAPSWSLDRSYTIHTGAVNDLTFNPAGTRIATASSDGTAKVFDLGTQAVTLLAHTSAVLGIAWSSTNTIATVGANGELRLWSAAGALLRTYVYGSALNDVAWHPSGSFLAAASDDGNVVMFEAATGNRNPQSGHFGNAVLHVGFNGTGDRLVSSSRATQRSDPTLVTWTVTDWNNFAFLDQRFGAHADATTGFAVPAAEYAPGGARIASGAMDATVKTWSPALVQDRLLLGHRIGSSDTTRYNGGDGIADASGGMVYFIAQNRTELPYSARFVANQGDNVANLVPANGTLVAFMGAFDATAKHGTLMASSIVGRAMTRFFDPTTMKAPSPPQVYGIAPNAKLIAVADIYTTTIFDGWRFAVEGYDGIPGTGDEAQIVANSFGFSSTFEDGWDFYSRFADWISTQYAGGKSLFTVSAGNDGNGYGTVTTPAASAGVVTAGASTDFFYRFWAGLEKGPSPSYGDVVPFSSRGPSALGRPDPDVLATGRMSVGATPLNMVVPSNGAVASELWSGTSLSSPMTAGILALIYEAYRKAHGVYPDGETAKSILMSGADDVNYDVFSQGAGFANADRATRIAQRLDGVSVTPTVWTPGEYRGRAYEAFVSLMSPGQSRQGTFTVRNANRTAPATWTLSDSVFRRTAAIEYGFLAPVDGSANPIDAWHALLAASPAADFYGPGVYRVTPAGLTLLAPVTPSDWINADLVRITISAPQTAFDPGGDGTNDYRYMVDVYDWTETDWSTPIPDTTGFADLNRISINHPEANVFAATVHNGPIRSHDGLVFGTRLFGTGLGGLPLRAKIEFFTKTDWNWLSLSAPQVTAPGNGGTTFTATMAVPASTPMGTYQGQITLRGRQTATDRYTVGASGGQWIRLSRFDTNPITVQVNSVPVPAGSLQTYPAAGLIWISSPLTPGDLVEVQYDYYDHVTIPVAVSIGATGPRFSFGGLAAGQDDLFGNFVGPGYGNGGQAGDFRFYYTDIANEGLFRQARGLKFYLDAHWDRTRTDLDVFAFGTGGVALMDVSSYDPNRYGPFLVGRNNGGSEITSSVFTTTGGAEEIVAPGVTGGLNIVAVHAVRMNGTADEESVTGSAGLLTVNPSDINIVTNQLAGSRALSLSSSATWPGLGAVSAGPSAPQRFVDLHIQQDAIEGGGFTDLLAKGSFTYRVLVQRSALIFDVHITSDAASTSRPCPDLDLGVFLDGKGPGNVPDGVAQTAEFVAQTADSDANEEVKLIKPVVEDDPDTPTVDESVVGAPYLVKVLGFVVPWSPYGTFNMDLTLVQGQGFSVSGTSSTPIPSYARSTLTLTWNLPGSTGDGALLGALYLGPSTAPLTLLIPIQLVVDRSPPVFTSFSVGGPGVLVDDRDGRTANGRRPLVVAVLGDPERGELDPAATRISIDGEDVTSRAFVDIPWGPSPQGLQGRWTGTVTYEPTLDLDEGVHTVRLDFADLAGNAVEVTKTIVVDTEAPALVLDGPALRFTLLSTATISGATEPGATVSIGSSILVAGADGTFSFSLSLADGRNEVRVRAADWFHMDALGVDLPGNEAVADLTIIRDTVSPAVTVTAPASPTPSDLAEIRGRVTESISSTEMYDPSTVLLTVGGRRAWVLADGSFFISVSLVEGVNTISIEAVDLAGNFASRSTVVVRDSLAPSLAIDPVPVETGSPSLNVTGTTEATALVFVNGFVVRPASDGTFHRVVTLSGGQNAIVVRAEDSAGNTAERTFTVSYLSAGGGGVSFGAWVAIGLVLAILAGLGIAFLFGRMSHEETPTPDPTAMEDTGPEPGAAAVAETPAPPPVLPPVERPAEPPAPAAPTIEERAAKIEAAYVEGRITREVYERNVRALGREPTPEPTAPEPAPAPMPTPEERAERLRTAFEQGRISREAYESNLAKLGLAPPAPTPPPAEEQAARLESAFRSGRITEAAYRANLARLGIAPPEPPAPPPVEDEKVARLERAYREGRLSREAYEANLARVAGTPAPPLPPPEDLRAAKLETAYREGRITEETYRANVARLGLAPPPPPSQTLGEAERAAMLDRAYQEGRISQDMYRVNLAKLAHRTPTEAPDKIVQLRTAFVEGRIDRRLFAENLARTLGVSGDTRAANLVTAFVAGRLDADLLEKNLRRLQQG